MSQGAIPIENTTQLTGGGIGDGSGDSLDLGPINTGGIRFTTIDGGSIALALFAAIVFYMLVVKK